MKVTCAFLLLFLFNLNSQAQSNYFVDSRDAKIYQTVEIGDKIWFEENLKLETNLSYCPNFNKRDTDCNKGNYYTNTELNSLCPYGWRVATLRDWEDYFSFMKTVYGVNNDQIQLDTLTENAEGAMILDASAVVKLLGQDTPLKLEAIGWVEGINIENYGTVTLWVNNEITKDPNYHVHIGKRSYVRHTHKHHIEDEPDKVRKFSVRCVCDKP